MSNFKTKFCWWPVRLARLVKDCDYPDLPSHVELIGWKWLETVELTRNIGYGWLVFLDSKPMPKRCKSCGQVIKEVAG